MEPPSEAMRVPVQQLREFAVNALSCVGVPDVDATLIADLMIDTDLRGVLTHGTAQLNGYVRQYREGKLNPAPTVRVLRDDPATAVIDGGGGLGHMPARLAAEMAIAKARALGVGAVTTRNHGHYGSAGKYTRMAVRQNCAAFCASGHPINPNPTNSLQWNPMGDPPMSFAFPAGEEAPPTLDMSTSFFKPEQFETLFATMPAPFYRSVGLVMTSLMFGGLLAGTGLPEMSRENRVYSAADYGAFICVWDVERFLPVADFKAEVDRSIRAVQQLPPLPGNERYELPGGPEWRRERAWTTEGIPVGREHMRRLEEAAALSGAPFSL
jgi:L-2-hydroxycarboxylate dehydrogenase (NAD+)